MEKTYGTNEKCNQNIENKGRSDLKKKSLLLPQTSDVKGIKKEDRLEEDSCSTYNTRLILEYAKNKFLKSGLKNTRYKQFIEEEI